MDSVLQRVLSGYAKTSPCNRLVALELGAESTKHADYIMQRFGEVNHNALSHYLGSWQLTDAPSGIDELNSSWRKSAHRNGVLPPPLALRFEDDVAEWRRVITQAPRCNSATIKVGGVSDVGGAVVDLLFTANTFHVAPWASCVSALSSASACLREQSGCLVVYGPFLITDQYRATMTDLVGRGNLPAMQVAQKLFAKSLTSRFGRHAGLRDVESVIEAASAVGLRLEHQVILPEGNVVLAWRK
jgi:hypothetical protein